MKFTLLKKIGVFFIVLFIFFIALVPYFHLGARWTWKHFHVSSFSTFLSPLDAPLAYSIGNYYFNHGAYDTEKAEKYLRLAIKNDPQMLEAHYQLGRLLFINGKFMEANREIDTVISINPDFEKAYYMKGLILGYQGHLEKGAPYFEEFIRRAPHEWAGYNDLAWLYFQMGEYGKVRETTERGLEVSPVNPWLLNMEGLALLNLGEKERAEKYFSQAKERVDAMHPEDWGRAYPGNDPSIYAEGLNRMREAIGHNLELVEAGSEK